MTVNVQYAAKVADVHVQSCLGTGSVREGSTRRDLGCLVVQDRVEGGVRTHINIGPYSWCEQMMSVLCSIAQA